jgi:hypothetical protein
VKMLKSYMFSEIETFLKEKLVKCDTILTFGFIGSRNVERDLDTIITKKKESSLSDFYKEVHEIYDLLDSYLLKKHNARAVRFDGYEPEELELAEFKKNDLAFHTMIYCSFGQIKKHWDFSLFEDEKIESILKDNYKCIYGDVKDIFSSDFLDKSYADNMFIYLQMYDRFNSNYPVNFLIKVMNHYFDFMLRKRLGLEKREAKTIEEAKEIFYYICDEIDKLNREKNVEIL